MNRRVNFCVKVLDAPLKHPHTPLHSKSRATYMETTVDRLRLEEAELMKQLLLKNRMNMFIGILVLTL